MKKLLLGLLLVCGQVFASPQSVPVLMYHQIEDIPAEFSIRLDAFTKQMEWLRSQGYTTITISELAHFVGGNHKLPPKTVAITFDDGWKNILPAAAVLAQHNMAATFYVMSGVFDSPLYLSKREVQTLARNPRFEIGAHTHTHFMQWINDLTQMDIRIMVGEIAMSKTILEQTIGKPVQSFAWPFGYTRPEAFAFVETIGFTSTVLVNDKTDNTKSTSPLMIKRVNIDGRCTLRQFQNMVITGILERCDEKVD